MEESVKCGVCGTTEGNIQKVGSQNKCKECTLLSDQYNSFVDRLNGLDQLHNKGMTSTEIADILEEKMGNVSSKLGKLYKFGVLDRKNRKNGQKGFIYTFPKKQLKSKPKETKSEKLQKINLDLENQINDLNATVRDRNIEVEELNQIIVQKDNEINSLKIELDDVTSVLDKLTGGVTEYLIKHKMKEGNIGMRIMDAIIGSKSSHS